MSTPASPHPVPSPAALGASPESPAVMAPADALRASAPPRVRFIAVRVHRTPGGVSRAEVELQSVAGAPACGVADVEPSTMGEVRAAALAAIEALHVATPARYRFGLRGIKSVRAFDQTVVLVQLAVIPPAGTAGDGLTQLVGAVFAVGDLPHAAVLAVLNATNRVLSGRPVE